MLTAEKHAKAMLHGMRTLNVAFARRHAIVMNPDEKEKIAAMSSDEVLEGLHRARLMQAAVLADLGHEAGKRLTLKLCAGRGLAAKQSRLRPQNRRLIQNL